MTVYAPKEGPDLHAQMVILSLTYNTFDIFFSCMTKFNGKSHMYITVSTVGGRVVRVVDLESHALHCYGLKSHQGLLILPCEEVIQIAYGMLVVLLRCLKK